jgi:hypothetical protein
VICHLTAQTKQQQLQDALLFLQVAEALRLLVVSTLSTTVCDAFELLRVPKEACTSPYSSGAPAAILHSRCISERQQIYNFIRPK